MNELPPMLHLPARDIPIPTSVSAEAQAVLAMPPMTKTEHPALDELETRTGYERDGSEGRRIDGE